MSQIIINLMRGLEIPNVPNYLIFSGGEKLADARKIDIADVTDTELGRIGSAWTAELLRRAEARRKGNNCE